MSQLPQFPLKLVVFPGEDLNLHIFEERYKQLITESFENQIPFGIPSVIEERKYGTGCSVIIKEISKIYANGKMDIKTKGVKNYEILNYQKQLDGKLYPGAEVNYIEHHDDSDLALNKVIIRKIEELYKLMDVKISARLDPYAFRIYMLVHKIGLTYLQELHVRDLRLESEKQKFVLEHLEALIPEVVRLESMKHKILMNGHFKDLKSYDL